MYSTDTAQEHNPHRGCALIKGRKEGFLRAQLLLIERVNAIHILIWIDALPNSKRERVLGRVGKLLVEMDDLVEHGFVEVAGQGLKAGPEELKGVFEL